MVFIDDGNLSLVSQIPDPNVQIYSFPEATFRNVTHILQKLPPQPTVDTVVLAIGTHNREQHPERTAIKQLQELWRKGFP